MNKENEIPENINNRIKKISVGAAGCILAMALLAIVVSNTGMQKENKVTTTVPESSTTTVQVQLKDVPDTRDYTTIIVPATEMTTVTEVFIQELESQEPETRGAPDSYSLPLGMDVGNDYSMGVPVYNSVLDDWRTHDGVDFNGAYGDSVKSIAGGIVRDVYDDAVMGSVIVVDHGGGVEAAYCGVEPADGIVKGVILDECEIIGTLGEIPCEIRSEHAHLHLEIRVDSELSDPLEVMGYYE